MAVARATEKAGRVGLGGYDLLVLAGVAIAYFASPRLATVGVKALAFASGHAVPWLIAYATVAMSWWWTLAHVGGVDRRPH